MGTCAVCMVGAAPEVAPPTPMREHTLTCYTCLGSEGPESPQLKPPKGIFSSLASEAHCSSSQ